MVGCDALNRSCFEFVPKLCFVLRIANRGVHFQTRSFPFHICFVEGEMLRQCLSCDNRFFIVTLGRKRSDSVKPFSFDSAGKVQYVEAMTVLLCEFDCQLCCQKGSDIITPLSVCGHICPRVVGLISFNQSLFVVCMRGDKTACFGENLVQSITLVDQERSG